MEYLPVHLFVFDDLFGFVQSHHSTGQKTGLEFDSSEA